MKQYAVFGLYSSIIDVVGFLGVFSTREGAEDAIASIKKREVLRPLYDKGS